MVSAARLATQHRPDDQDGLQIVHISVEQNTEVPHTNREHNLDTPLSHDSGSIQKLLFPDLTAFRYLQEDKSVRPIEAETELIGYELHLVEQWACSRVHPTSLIVTFTGLSEHKVPVGVLEVPKDPSVWSYRLRAYLKAVISHHTRRKETSLGTVMVTNLNHFPSALTVIPIAYARLRDYRESFIINENMKRLGCSGRAGLNLGSPPPATEAKFYQLYRTSEVIPAGDAVIELVRLCQVVLVMFMKLLPECVDGLLCDMTEKALGDWWAEIGMEYFTVEPNDGVLGPTSVAALLGLFLGARNRLNAFGAPVAKDAFDLKATKRAIGCFQKSQKLRKSRRLDHQTLNRLHRVTSRAANSEGWAVPRAVKSTVAELSGKGGEMVMGIVGGREKVGISEVETLDLKKFVSALSGEHCKWLWQGRAKKVQSLDFFGNLTGDDEAVGIDVEYSGLSRPYKEHEVQEEPADIPIHNHNFYEQHSFESQSSLEPSNKEQGLPRAVLKSVSGRMSEARSGIGRFKDVVGIPIRRAQPHQPVKDANTISSRRDLITEASGLSAHQSTESFTTDPKETRRSRYRRSDEAACHENHVQGIDLTRPQHDTDMKRAGLELIGSHSKYYDRLPSSSATGLSQPRSVSAAKTDCIISPNILRSRSFEAPGSSKSFGSYGGTGLVRHASFSGIEQALQEDYWGPPHGAFSNNLSAAIAHQHFVSSSYSSMLVDTVLRLQGQAANVSGHDVYMRDLQARAVRDLTELRIIYDQKLIENNGLLDAVADLFKEEKSSISETVKNAEGVGAKLEYELNALDSRIEDVEDGITDFEHQVLELESRARDLDADKSQKNSWIWQALAILPGR